MNENKQSFFVLISINWGLQNWPAIPKKDYFFFLGCVIQCRYKGTRKGLNFAESRIKTAFGKIQYFEKVSSMVGHYEWIGNRQGRKIS